MNQITTKEKSSSTCRAAHTLSYSKNASFKKNVDDCKILQNYGQRLRVGYTKV
jgi:hypothetical protein